MLELTRYEIIQSLRLIINRLEFHKLGTLPTSVSVRREIQSSNLSKSLLSTAQHDPLLIKDDRKVLIP